MLRSDDYETALVPYIPPEKGKSDWLECLFLSRKSVYLFFLASFFLISAFARCVCLQNRAVSLEAYEDLKSFSSVGGYVPVFRFYLPQFVCAFSAFFAGFTIFALPIAFLAFLHSQLCFSFFYFALTENALGCGFYKGLAALLWYSFFSALSVFYYSEALFTGSVATKRGLFLRGGACLVYLIAAFFVLRFFSGNFFY